MKKSLTLIALFIALCSFKGDTVYDATRDGHYRAKGDNGKFYGWTVKGNPKHSDKVDFFHAHKTEPTFTASMIDETHFKTKGLLGHTETDGAFTREYNVYGEFVDSTGVFLHIAIHRTRQMGNQTLVKDTSYQCTYRKHASATAADN